MDNEPSGNVERFDLFFRDGPTRVVWRLRDNGVELEPDAIVVHRDGRTHRTPFADIVNVTLNSALVGRRSMVAMCTMNLRNGGRIVVSNSAASGLPDGLRDDTFRAFVTSLHQRLVNSGAARNISFRSGFSNVRINVLRTALVAAAALFVVLPIVLLIITGEVKALFLALAGGFLVYPALKAASANSPATYRPEAPPDMVA